MYKDAACIEFGLGSKFLQLMGQYGRTRVHKQAFKVLGHSWVKECQRRYCIASFFYTLYEEMKLKCCYCQCRKSSDLWNMVSVNRYFVDDALNSLHVCGVEGWRTAADKKYKAVRTLVNVFSRHVASNIELWNLSPWVQPANVFYR